MTNYIQEKLVGVFEKRKRLIEIPYDSLCKSPVFHIIDFVRKEGAETTLVLSPELFSELCAFRDSMGNCVYNKANNVICGFPLRIDTTVPKGILVIEEITYHSLNESSSN